MTEPNTSAQQALPPEIVEAISISNAKAIGEQPALLANLALANQVFEANMQQLARVNQQQALNVLTLALLGKAVSLLLQSQASGPDAANYRREIVKIIHDIHEVSAKAVPPASHPPTQS